MTEQVDVLAVMDADGRAVACVLDDCEAATMREHKWIAHLAAHDKARAAVAELIEALTLAEATIAASVKASGYKAGECTDGWVPELRAEVAALVPIRAALARVQGGAA